MALQANVLTAYAAAILSDSCQLWVPLSLKQGLEYFEQPLGFEDAICRNNKNKGNRRKPTQHQQPQGSSPRLRDCSASQHEKAKLMYQKKTPTKQTNQLTTQTLLSFKWYLKVNEHANQPTPLQDSKNNISKPQCCGQECVCNAGTLQQQQQKPFARVNEVLLAAERM